MASALPAFPEFSLRDQTNLATRWEKYLKRFNNLMTAMKMTDETRKRALLLHYVGEEVNDLFDTLPDKGEDNDFKKASEALTRYFTPKKNVSFEVFKFRNLKQESNETVDEFHTRLQIASKYCEFGENKEKEIKAQIELGTTNKKLRRYSFRTPTLTLTALLDYARTLHETEKQARGIEGKHTHSPTMLSHFEPVEDEVHKVQPIKPKYSSPSSRYYTKPNTPFDPETSKQQCFRCGYAWPHNSGRKCPAEGQQCKNCLKYNHFARVCRSRSKNNNVNEDSAHAVQTNGMIPPQPEYNIEESTDSDNSDHYIYTLHKEHKKEPLRSFHAKLKLGNTYVRFQIDSGSSANIIDEDTFMTIQQQNPSIRLKKSKQRLFAFGSTTPLPVVGQFECVLESKKRFTSAKIIVVRKATGCLLSGQTSIDLNFITINVNKIHSKPTQKPAKSKLADDDKVPHRLKPVIRKYDEVFHGIGKLTDVKVHLHINKDVKPVVQPPRRIPFALRTKVETELRHLQKQGIIEPAQGPSLWVSPIVAFPKPNNPDKIRLCVDMRQPNNAIQRERHPQPTIDDLINDLNGARYFSKLDLNSAYHQLELDKESRYITTFTTHKGLFQYKRLNFGTNSASEIFQHTIQTVFNGISGCRNISDDIIVFGSTQSEHDQALEKVLQIAKERNLRFGFNKCEFDKKQLEFFGYVFSDQGISPSSTKVAAVKDAPIPKNASEVRSFLGMIQYCGRFIPNLAAISAPLRLLTHKGEKWTWTSREQHAFDTLKDLLTTEIVVGYFDSSKHTELHVDASPFGLGAILTQTTPGRDDTKVIAYASRALTDTESRYSQIEREALAIVYGIEHFHLYLYGHEFLLITDHKPLELIYQNPKSHTSARLERWCLRLQDYTFQVKYRPGPTNPSDYLSRHPLTKCNSHQLNLSDNHVRFVAQNAVPVAMDIDNIRKAVREDPTLQKLIEIIQTNTWNSFTTDKNTNIDLDELQAYKKVQHELSLTPEADLIIRGYRLVIPKQLREQAVRLAHEGHQGLVKTKKLLREKVWFPRIDTMVETALKQCLACQSVGQPNNPAPLEMMPIPENAWDTVYVDFLGPFPARDLLLVMIDGRTRFPEVEVVRSTNAKSTIQCFERVFATHGLPKVIVSDNGSPFQSHDIREYMLMNNITHRKITPLWPQANAEAETFMKPLKKCMQTASIERKNLKQELHKFLMNYRATPHCTTKVPPATALFGRVIRTKLPHESTPIDMEEINRKIDKADRDAKVRRKTYADKRRGAKEPNFKIGDQVLVRQTKINKLTPRFNPKPYRVTAIKGTMITARRPDHMITRNCSHFKIFTGCCESDTNSEMSEEIQSDADELIGENGHEEQAGREEPDERANRRYPARQRYRPLFYRDEQLVI